MLQVLTPTGARPEAFALCARWMARQTYRGAVRWIVVDDGPEPLSVPDMPENIAVEVVRPEPFWREGQNTQARNLLAGLAVVRDGIPLVIFEDDDWYADDWLDHCAEQLKRAELVGECRARYYNVATNRGRQLRNERHASLCSTAMRGKAIQTFRKACQRRPKFIDLELWRTHRSRFLFGGHRVVGIKGLPGRGGIGMGHSKDFAGQSDTDHALLREWVGDDAEVYA